MPIVAVVLKRRKFPAYPISPTDGYPVTTDVAGKMLIGYGANADRYETWKAYPEPAQDSQQPFVGSAPLNTYPATPAARTGTGFLISGRIPAHKPSIPLRISHCRPSVAVPPSSPAFSTTPTCSSSLARSPSAAPSNITG